ncbi:MAG: DUF2156 domain-containing protein [Promethearchaeota archaeon]
MDLTKAKPIQISDKPLFDEYLNKFPPEISEFTFTNLFIWRNYYKFSFLEWDDHILIFSKIFFRDHKENLSKNLDSIFYLHPIGAKPVEIILDLFNNLKHIEIHRVPKSLVDKLGKKEEAHSLNIKWMDDRDNWDYVYEKEKLINLSGRKLYRKRRWLRRFFEKYPNHKFKLFSKDWLKICKQLQIRWCIMHGCLLHKDLMEEQKAISDAFDFFPDLKYRGGLLLVDGKCIAYTLGELLNPTTVVIHIEKALIDYEGSYQAINHYFVKNCCEKVTYVNREQDLGDPGLRQAKETYLPHHMVKKYIIYRDI